MPSAELSVSAASAESRSVALRIRKVPFLTRSGVERDGSVMSKTTIRPRRELLTTTSAVKTGLRPVVSITKFSKRMAAVLLRSRNPPECIISPRASAKSIAPSMTGEVRVFRVSVDSSTFETRTPLSRKPFTKVESNLTTVVPEPIDSVGAANAGVVRVIMVHVSKDATV